MNKKILAAVLALIVCFSCVSALATDSEATGSVVETQPTADTLRIQTEIEETVTDGTPVVEYFGEEVSAEIHGLIDAAADELKLDEVVHVTSAGKVTGSVSITLSTTASYTQEDTVVVVAGVTTNGQTVWTLLTDEIVDDKLVVTLPADITAQLEDNVVDLAILSIPTGSGSTTNRPAASGNTPDIPPTPSKTTSNLLSATKLDDSDDTSAEPVVEVFVTQPTVETRRILTEIEEIVVNGTPIAEYFGEEVASQINDAAGDKAGELKLDELVPVTSTGDVTGSTSIAISPVASYTEEDTVIVLAGVTTNGKTVWTPLAHEIADGKLIVTLPADITALLKDNVIDLAILSDKAA